MEILSSGLLKFTNGHDAQISIILQYFSIASEEVVIDRVVEVSFRPVSRLVSNSSEISEAGISLSGNLNF